ncbi:MAG: diacylglycerol kinase family lipid kinase [Edaphocola sp.]
MEKILFIINPRSGVDRAKALQSAIAQHLDATKFDPTIAYTEYPKHGTALAADAVSKGYAVVVAVGGDGSVNDIVAGLQGSNVALGIVPKGSGNGLARSLAIPLDAVAAIKKINAGNRVKIDLGRANGHLFTSNAGVGFDALVAKKFAKSKRRGMAAYSWIVTKYLWRYKEWDWSVNIDGTELQRQAFILTVANAEQFGYNFKIAPVADLQDGLFDVVIIKKYPKIIGAAIAMRAFAGTLLNSRYVEHYKGRAITISHPQLSQMQIDGDVVPCSEQVVIEMLPAALTVLL